MNLLAQSNHVTFLMEPGVECALAAARSVLSWSRIDTQKREYAFSVEGFNDDPRPLDVIPEARATLLAFGEAIGLSEVRKFTPDLRGLLLVCMGLGIRDGENLMVPTELMTGAAEETTTKEPS